MQKSKNLERIITVPFCPESELSGISFKDFIPAVWYQRPITVPETWAGFHTYIHIGAADFETEVFLDGHPVGRHIGGSSSFRFDLSPYVRYGHQQSLVISVRDELRTGNQTGGKQSLEYNSNGCFYTRTTGIWQTVWLERVPRNHIKCCTIIPIVDQGAFIFQPHLSGVSRGSKFRVRAFDEGRPVGELIEQALPATAPVLRIDSPQAWSPEHPKLYDFELSIVDDGNELDEVNMYGGLREVHIVKDRLLLNNEPLYLRMVLDQGFFPGGIWTAPSDEDLRRDIQLALSCGFNGARLHQKMFEPRFHYWADRLGYLTWAESPSWGLNIKSDLAARNFLSEWREAVTRDFNHPSIIGWTPLNETWDILDRKQHRRLHTEAYELTKNLDPTRPVNGASGGCHVITDLYTVHIYEQNPKTLKEILTPSEPHTIFRTLGEKEAPYTGQPYFVDEFGGIKLVPEGTRAVKDSWGYGESPHSVQEFHERLQGQVEAVLSCGHISGYCYTQLTDVEQEQNGLFYFDRTPKFDLKRIKEVFSKSPPAKEK